MGYNGAHCVGTKANKRSQLFHRPLPDGAADRLIDFSVSNDHFVNVYLDGRLFSLIN